MKLHFFTKETATYSFDSFFEIMEDEEFELLNQNETIESILNSERVIDSIRENDWYDLVNIIDPLFDMTNNGVFDWEEKTCDYYDFYNRMLHELNCNLENNAGEVISTYFCELSDRLGFSDSILSLYIPNFYCGNGEPEGAQLALKMVECFMESNQWNVAFYDADNELITDIASWSKKHILDIRTIKPIVWFGNNDIIHECWSITPETTDLFIKEFWGDYYEGALQYICNANAGCGIYYSVWEFGLDYDKSIFDDIKNKCPINLELLNENRVNALFNLIIQIYNEHKSTNFPIIEKDCYSEDVLDCIILVKSPIYNYSYTKPYRFKSSKLEHLNNNIIEDILLEDTSYVDSLQFLKEIIIDCCDLSSYKDVWKRVQKVVSTVQDKMNNSLLCQIIKDDKVLSTVPFAIKLGYNYLPISEINNIVFMKSLIDFLKRGSWHIGYKEASQLPSIYNAYAQVVPQEGSYPIVWFNDSDEIVGKLGIWPAHSQYMLSLIWKNVSSFCSTVFNNIDVHNKFQGSSIYNELELEFESIKAKCPIHIHSGNEPIDFNELKQFVERNCCNEDT